MPKSQQERNTENPLGQKINALMREKGICGDYRALANVFDVKTPSVYDWVDHGRLSKDRYAALVKWSGRSLDWWFDIPSAEAGGTRYERATPENAQKLTANDNTKTHRLERKAPGKSPFARVSDEEWRALTPEMVREIETYTLGLMAGMRLTGR